MLSIEYPWYLLDSIGLKPLYLSTLFGPFLSWNWLKNFEINLFPTAGSNKKMLDRKATFVSGLKNKHQKKQRSQKGLQKIGSPSLLEKAKKQYKKRKSSTSASTVAPAVAAVASEAPSTPAAGPEKVSGSSSSSKKIKIGNVSPKKSAIARRKSQIFNDSDLDSDAENNVDEQLEPNVEASQTLRSWIDNYEEAVTNHYSPELRARSVAIFNLTY